MAFDVDLAERTTDTIKLRSGVVLSLRFAGPGDARRLQSYFRTLSMSSRYNRLMSAMKELPDHLLEGFVRPGNEGAYSVIAMIMGDHAGTVVAEARYAWHADEAAVEFGLSVADHWQDHGIGASLISNLGCRAAALGAHQLYGETLRTNLAMLALARNSGFTPARAPHDWKQVRLEKQIAAPQLVGWVERSETHQFRR